MKSRSLNLYLAFSLSFLTLSVWRATAAEKQPPLVTEILEAVLRNEKRPSDRNDESFNAWDFAIHPNNTKAGILGVTALWKKGQRGLVELAWWRQKDPEVRKCILMLFYSLSKEEASNFPEFVDYAARFGKPEAEARAAEIQEIKRIANENRLTLEKAFLVE
jgi:hypothetical protein